MSMTPTEMRAYIMAAPDPLTPGVTFTYEGASVATAKAMLIVCDEDLSLLEVPTKEEDPTGIERAFADRPWKAACKRWDGLDEWLGGITGYMFGWANSQVRYVLNAEQVGNPALMTIAVKS